MLLVSLTVANQLELFARRSDHLRSSLPLYRTMLRDPARRQCSNGKYLSQNHKDRRTNRYYDSLLQERKARDNCAHLRNWSIAPRKRSSGTTLMRNCSFLSFAFDYLFLDSTYSVSLVHCFYIIFHTFTCRI